MDPISQGALGAIAALNVSPHRHARLATVTGWAAGMLADADIFIRSIEDPLLNIQYHRHFTHALAFIPVGSLIAAAFFWLLLRKKASFASLYLYCAAGYATAGLLDACTSYGTQLLWPFSDERLAWGIVSVIDPAFTVPLIGFALWALIRRSPAPGRFAAAWAILYLGFGWLQNQRAADIQSELAASRGHAAIEKPLVKPAIGSLILWRSIYRYEDRFYTDAIRLGYLGSSKTYQGTSLPVFDLESAMAPLPPDSVKAKDLQRFAHFSDHYLARLPDEKNFITDLRYSSLVNGIAPLWGIDISNPDPDAHVGFETRRLVSAERKDALLGMLLGRDLETPLPTQ